jgi:hypothetical protein
MAAFMNIAGVFIAFGLGVWARNGVPNLWLRLLNRW